jgi:site-specific DNA-methyltransferase (adenine-specific)
MEKQRAPRNRTLTIDDKEMKALQSRLITATKPMDASQIINKTFNNDLLDIIDYFPEKSVDLLVIDPPYNLDKNFNGYKFNKSNDDAYIDYLESWFPKVIRLLKQNGSLYICGDWKCTSALYRVVSKYLIVRNRITWQREKGRGAKSNWKNCTEDIWFATVTDDYYFDVDSVKMKRKVIAPYKENGKPKDWEETEDGNFRLTHPSNFWDDITIPYWSMPENTDHPTQKPEKLIAKLILASCPAGGMVFDPFLGSGTTSVVAKKLNRNYCGIELNNEYCCWAEKRLEQAAEDNSIQGYSDGLFWERNTLNLQKEK